LFIFAIALLTPLITINLEPTGVRETVAGYEHILTEKIFSAQNALLFDNDLSGENIPSQISYSINWISVLLLVYLIGVLFFSLRMIYSFIHIYFLIRKSEKVTIGNTIVVIRENDIVPFSWMKYIILSRTDYEEGESILMHELAHVKHWHSLDLLISNLLAIFQWYNPVMWFMKKELQDIHEFEADSYVLNSGIDAKKYQLLLIKKAAGTSSSKSMTNSFNHSNLKKRITMMLKEESKPWARLKYLAILPLTVLSIALFANPDVSKNISEISSAEVTKIIVKEQPVEGLWKAVEASSFETSESQSFKIISNGTFFSFRADMEGNVYTGAGGTYTYKDGVYTETILYTLQGMTSWRGKKGEYKSTFPSSGKWLMEGLLDGRIEVKEEWEKVK
jgi:beta-lactamase regulating signal transducer with metallopeptidase domain